MATPPTTAQRVLGAILVAGGVGILWMLWSDPVGSMETRRGPLMPVVAPMLTVLGLALLVLPPPPQPPPGQKVTWRATPGAWKAALAGAIGAGIVHLFVFFGAVR